MRKIRSDVWRAILITSIFWLILDVFILFYYLDKSQFTPEKRIAVRMAKFARSAGLSGDPNLVVTSENWMSDELKRLISELNFDPFGPGASGAGVTIDKDNEEEMKEMFKINQFNLMASNLVSINRTLQDYRSDRCKESSAELKAQHLEPVSIIIVFHNEAFSTLLRTLHSVMNRSPHNLIEEIILIDDLSERDFLKEPLGQYIKRFPIPIHLVHLKERSGLIRARLTGSAMAKGKILLFLDAHVEVSEGWLEPLISRIIADRTIVVAPIIDVISDETFEYVTASDITWGGFNWHLNFRWYPVPVRELERRNYDRSLPIRTPTIAGGLFAIDRQYFYDIGSYDEGMQVWGGENLEISFRVWTCGGSLEIHPCSRVGHVFRKQTPYTFPGGTATVIYHNAARTAEVWMDDYKRFFYAVVPAARSVDFGNITARRQLRSNLKCKSFKWYLENIYKESPVPARYYSIGQIMNHESKFCLDTMGRKAGQPVGVSSCHGVGGNQAWCLTGNGEIRSDELCLTSKSNNKQLNEVHVEKCSEKSLPQHVFKYNLSTKNLVHQKSGECLIVSGGNLLLANCSLNSRAAIWTLENYREIFP